MLVHILALLIGIIVQTVFLFLAFWAMIKFQDLNYTFTKLLGVAVFVASLDQVLHMVLGHYLGFFLSNSVSSPIVFVASFISIKKLTEADQVDVMFTVAVGNALCFALNMWLLGTLIGDLRPYHHSHSMESEPAWQVNDITNSVPVMTNSLAATSILQQLTVKGATQNGVKSSANIFYDGKLYAVFYGETIFLPVNGKLVPVKLESVDTNSLHLNISGEPVKCPYH